MRQQKKLTIVSDTAMFRNDNESFAFGPVVRELEYIEDLFDEITWIGFDRSDKVGDLSLQKIKSQKIKIITLKNVGGSGLLSLCNIILQYPKMYWIITRQISKSNIIHTRAPSHPALIAIVYSFFNKKNKIWWNKYAGDWGQINTSISYGFQRKILKLAKFSRVTINGFWPDQLKHCFSFENPCLTETDINNGEIIANKKMFSPPFVFSFVGRFDNVKGVSILLEALKDIPYEMIDKIHLIGDGQNLNKNKKEARELGDKVIFHGFLPKKELHNFVASSHFLLLPSKAEGFPKVVAEAACYGVIPIVSDVGSISHYINSSNGFIWPINGDISYEKILSLAVNTNSLELKEKSKSILSVAKLFTFENYKNKLEKFIFSNFS
ncbi:glycosyltransferase family 4 protein [Flavobacterium sp.]|jgi:glycosyltransferase involved in cell wall biosynthesis|uniref:glycosyltransferase family 4 protein n=1 Tax=Flavobacterium sp. TaxID=239 RepID=UPI0037C1558C